MRRVCDRRLRPALALLALLGGVSWLLPGTAPAAARKAPPAAKADNLLTVTYDVADLMRSAPAWAGGSLGGAKVGPGGLDALVKLIVTSVKPDSWRGTGEGVSTLHEVHGTKLEIRTTAAN